MGDQFVFDCAGNRILVGDKRFAARCWVGNTSDFLEANAANIIAEAGSWNPVPRIAITVPIYRSGVEFYPTLKSLLAQEWKKPDEVEILLYVNQPTGAMEAQTKVTLEFLRNSSDETLLPLRIAGERGNLSADRPRIRMVFEQLGGGLADVYRRSFSTLVWRIRRDVDARKLTTKKRKADALNTLLERTVFAVVDDDLLFPDGTSLPKQLDSVKAGESVVLGEVIITSAKSAFPHLEQLLKNLMNLFLRFKQDLGTAILTPRAAAVKDLFHLPEIDPNIPYADQVWFAAAAQGKRKLFVKSHTTIVEEFYPSNAEMTARIGRYLESGEASDVLDIFHNLRLGYQDIGANRKFCLHELDALIAALTANDRNALEYQCAELLAK